MTLPASVRISVRNAIARARATAQQARAFERRDPKLDALLAETAGTLEQYAAHVEALLELAEER